MKGDVPVKCAGTGPSTLLHGNRTGPTAPGVKGPVPGPGSNGGRESCYYRGKMIKSPRVPSQERDPRSVTLRSQLPGGSKGQTRSSLDLRSRGSGHLSAGTGPKGLVHKRYRSYGSGAAGEGGDDRPTPSLRGVPSLSEQSWNWVVTTWTGVCPEGVGLT